MGIIAWVAVGATAGCVATFMLGTRDRLLTAIVLGVVGAGVGGILAGAYLDLPEPTGVNADTIVVSAVGAILVALAANLATGTSRERGGVAPVHQGDGT